MEFELKQQFLTQNDCYQVGTPLKPKGVMVHSTGVAQPDPMVFVQRWNKPGVEKCVHAFVGGARSSKPCPGRCGAGMPAQGPTAAAPTTPTCP